MRVLTIGDIHCPWERRGYLQFCQDLYYQWDCNQVVFIGDVVDLHAVSFHPPEPGCPGPTDEYKVTLEHLQKWYQAFPRAIVTIGNHDNRAIRKAKAGNIPDVYLKSFSEIWKTPKWKWVDDCVIDDVYYYHGTGQGGEYPASNAVRKMLMSVVMGHNHTASGVKYYVNPMRRIFSCDTGVGSDDKAMAMAYGRNNKRKSVMSAAVIINGIPYVEPMPCGKGEPYWDGNFGD